MLLRSQKAWFILLKKEVKIWFKFFSLEHVNCLENVVFDCYTKFVQVYMQMKKARFLTW
jgi:hypothetical protein